MNHARLLVAFVAMSQAPATIAAPVVTIDGRAQVAGTRVNDVFTSTIELVDEQGVVLLASSLPSLPVTDGLFSIDLDIAAAVPALERGEVILVRVELRDDLVTSTTIGPVWRVAVADRAQRALLAADATTLGAIPAAELVPDDGTLAFPIAFANLVGVPPGIVDGVDNGTIDALTGLAIVGGTLDVAPGGVTDIATGTLRSQQITDGTLSSAQLGTVGPEKFADGTLTGANFSDDAFSDVQVSGTIAVFRRPFGCASPQQLTTETSCARETCTTAFGCNATTVCLRVCGTLAGCENLGTNPALSARFCDAPGDYEFLGRLIRDP